MHKRSVRKRRYLRRVYELRWYLSTAWLRALNWLLLNVPRPRSYAGIRIVDLDLRGERDTKRRDAHLELIRAALDLLAACDVRRFHLVQRELCYITNGYDAGGGGSYRWVMHECRVHLEGFLPSPPVPDDPVYQWWMAVVASILVHEATHGRVHRYGIGYRIKGDRQNWQRIEKLCRKQEQYFADRIPFTNWDYKGSLVKPLDVAWYQAYFAKSRRQLLRELIAYLRQYKKQDVAVTQQEKPALPPRLPLAGWGIKHRRRSGKLL